MCIAVLKRFGSSALPGLMLDIGLLFRECFFLFLNPAGDSNISEHYPNPSSKNAGQS